MGKRKKVINEILERYKLSTGYESYIFAAAAVEAITSYLIREKASFSIDANYENNTGVCIIQLDCEEVIIFDYIYNT